MREVLGRAAGVESAEMSWVPELRRMCGGRSPRGDSGVDMAATCRRVATADERKYAVSELENKQSRGEGQSERGRLGRRKRVLMCAAARNGRGEEFQRW